MKKKVTLTPLWLLRLVLSASCFLLLRSEIPSSKRAKLYTMVASNNRDNMPRSLSYYCLFAHVHAGAVLIAHPVHGASRIQHSG